VGVGRGQLEVDNRTADRSQQMQAVAVEGLLFDPTLAKDSAVRSLITSRTRYQMKLYHRHGQAGDHTLTILGHIQHTQNHLADVVERVAQVAPPAIEAAAFGQDRKQMTVVLPLSKQVRFFIPFTAFTDNRHRDQFAIATVGLRPRSRVEWSDHLPNVV